MAKRYSCTCLPLIRSWIIASPFRVVAHGSTIKGRLDVKAAVYEIPEMPSWFNRTFKESVAKGGRIFSDEHPYFDVKEEDIERLQGMAEKIKKGFLNGN